MSYYLCAAGVRLRNQINRKFPKRDTKSDGWIGDASHQASPTSDHNPDWSAGGVVRAIDIDADLKPRANNHDLANQLARELRDLARTGGDRNRISYIIWNKRIASDVDNWTWRPYSGSNTHEHHIHVSFKPAGDKDNNRFPLPMLKILSR